MFSPDHIDGMRPREPIDGALTIGVKERNRGFPVEKDRFHIVMPYEADGRREYHPAFGFFNSAEPAHRKVIHGNLVHALQAECFEYHLKAQVLGRQKAHPDKMPMCVGDGERAVRWMGGQADNFEEIICPNDRCEYRLASPPSCKPWMRFLFRVRWSKEGLPTPTLKFTSGSWNTISNFLGFFKRIDEISRQLGLERPALFGLPFTMTLVERTKASAQRRFPTVSITPDIDPVEWFQQQRHALMEASGPRPEALTDASQQDPKVVYEDTGTISVPANRSRKK